MSYRVTPVIPILYFTLVAPLCGQTLLVANKTDDTVDLIDISSGKSRASISTAHSFSARSQAAKAPLSSGRPVR